MSQDEIVSVEIDQDGRLRITPRSHDFSMIYRSAMEVHWDKDGRFLFSPKPREWTYPMWFRQIIAAAADGGVQLTLTPLTIWTNVPDEMKSEMTQQLTGEGLHSDP